MQKNVIINNKVYSGVDTVILKDEQNTDAIFVETSDGTAAATDILNGKSAYVNGNKIIGSHICESTELKEKTITQNGVYNASEDDADGYSKVTVNVSSEGITPSGDISISENGTFDVTNFANAIVNVATAGGGTSEVKTGIVKMVKGEQHTIIHGFTTAPKAFVMLLTDAFDYNEHVGLVATRFESTSGVITPEYQVSETIFAQKNTTTGNIYTSSRKYTAVQFGDTEITLDNSGDYKLAGNFKWYALS